MKLLEIASQNELDHLYKVQAAKCYDLAICSNKGLSPDKVTSWKFFVWRPSQSEALAEFIQNRLRYPTSEPTNNSYKKIMTFYERMITAKRAFEHAGGKFKGPHYLKQ